jgi:hypothetical protein
MFAVSERTNDVRTMTARRRLNDHLASSVGEPWFRHAI